MMMERCCHCGELIGPRPGRVLTLGAVTLDTETQEVRVWGELRRIQRGKETAILAAMMRAPDRLFTKDNLENIAETWESDSNTLNVHLYRIRRALKDVLDIESQGIGWKVRLK